MKSKYPLKKGQIEEGVFEENYGVPSSNYQIITSDTEGNRSWVDFNSFAGPLLGQVDVGKLNVFYEDYITGPVVDFSLSPNKKVGAKVYVRVRGGLVGTIPATWTMFGDAISITDTDFNQFEIMYVSDKDVRMTNKIVPFLDTIAPSIPNNLQSSNITVNSFDLTWDVAVDSLGGSVTYNVFRDGVLESNVLTNTISITGLSDFIEYELTVTAIDDEDNESQPSTPLIVKTLDGIPPSIPTNILVGYANETSMTLTWDASTDNDAVASYNVYKDSVLETNVTDTTATISGLTYPQSYDITVSAIDISGNESAQSTVIAAETADKTPPPVPANFGYSNVTDKSIDFSWAEMSDPDPFSYNLYKDGTLLINQTGTTYTATDLYANTLYTFSLTTIDEFDNESASGGNYTIITAVDTTTPSVVTNIVASNITEQSVTLTWDASIDNSTTLTYHIFRDGTVYVGATNETTYDVFGLSYPGTYTFSIEAVDAAGNGSAMSDAITVETQDVTAPVISGGYGYGIYDTYFGVNWNDASDERGGVVTYNVYLDGVFIENIPESSYTWTGLQPETEYTFGYSAVDEVGNESALITQIRTTTADTYPPTITSATVEDAAPDNLVVVFSELVNITDLTGLTITGDVTPTIDSVSGSGTDTLTFVLSAALLNGQTVTFAVDGTNTIVDGAANALVATTSSITNNVAAV